MLRLERLSQKAICAIFLLLAALLLVSAPTTSAFADDTNTLVPCEINVGPGDDPCTMTAEWKLPASAEEGTEEGYTSGAGVIDHFNIYQDGQLVAQMKQNAIKASWTMYTYEDLGYYWKCTIPVAYPHQYYTFEVSSVDMQGHESALSQPDSYYAWGKSVISFADISYYGNETPGEAYVRIAIETSYNDRVHVYRDGQLLGTIRMREGMFNNVLEDYDAEPNATYVYRVVVLDSLEDETDVEESYTVTIPADSEITELARSFSFTDTSQYNGTVALSWFGEANCTYRVYRNGALIRTFNGADDIITFTNTPSRDGNYTYRVERTGRGAAVSTHFYYEKDSDRAVLGEVPDAPALSARIGGERVFLSWEAAQTGAEAQGYYLFVEDNNECYEWNRQSNAPLGYVLQTEASENSHVFDPAWSWPASDGSGNPATFTFYVCAYNEWGMGESSQRITYTAVDEHAPAEAATAKPAAPTAAGFVVRERNSIGMDTLGMAIEPAATGGAPTSYSIRCTRTPQGAFGYDDTQTFGWYDVDSWRFYFLSDYGYGNYTFSVIASNSKGSSSATSVTITYDAAPLLTATGGLKKVTLNWKAPDDGAVVSSYSVYRSSDNVTWEKLVDTAVATRTYVDTTVVPDREYYYRVTANEATKSVESNVVSVTTNGYYELCTAPTLSAKSTSEGIVLSWAEPEEGRPDLYYLCCINVTDGQTWASDWETQWFDMPARGQTMKVFDDENYAGKTMEFRIGGLNGAGVGDSSNIVRVTMPSEVVEAENYPYYVVPQLTEGESTLTLTWEQRTPEGYSDPLYYEIYRTNPRGDGYVWTEYFYVVANDDPTMTWVDTTPELGVLYTYWVIATNSFGSHDGWGLFDVSGRILGSADDPEVVAVEQSIMANIPADVSALTLDDAAMVAQIKAQYEDLGGNKRLVSEEARTRLAEAVQRIAQLQAEEESDRAAAETVTDLIDELDVDDIDLDNVDEVDAAKAAYDALSPAAKLLVDPADVQKLEECVQKAAFVREHACETHGHDYGVDGGTCSRCGTVASVSDYTTYGLKLVKYSPATAVASGMVASCNGKPMYWLPQESCWITVLSSKPTMATCFGALAGTKTDIVRPGYAGASTTIAGDLNASGTVNIVDAQIAYSIAMRELPIDSSAETQICLLMADVNGDGVVDASDARAIQGAVHKGWQ